MILLTLEQVLQIHILVVETTGGSVGLRDLGRLEAVIAAQSQHVFGRELNPTIESKAAAVIRGIVGDHPFIDGNKRTAMLAGLTLLEVNKIFLSIQPGELEDFAVKIATDKLEVTQITAWLNNHLSS